MPRPHPALVELAAGRPLPAVDDLADLVASASDHRMSGLLFSRVMAGELTVSPSVLNPLARQDLAVRAHQERLWSALRETTARLRRAGFDVATTKGVTGQARWYGRPGERPCFDLDLLIAPGDVPRVDDLVRRLDPDHPLIDVLARPIGRRYFQWVDIEVGRGVWIDLHLDPFKLGIGIRRPHIVWERSEIFVLPDGSPVRVLDAEMALVTFLLHMNRDRFPYLLGFADVARLLAREELDWRFLSRYLRDEGIDVPVHLALDTVLEVLHLSPVGARPSGWRTLAWRGLWPADRLLQGTVDGRQEQRRQFFLPLLVRGRALDTLCWWARRALPPRQVLDYFFGRGPTPYLWRLAAGRLGKAIGKRRATVDTQTILEATGRGRTALRKARIALTPRSWLLRTRLGNGAVVYGRNRPGYGGRGVYIERDALEPELLYLEDLLGPQGVFVDVGANTGVYTLKAARHYGPQGTVVAVEPFVDVLATLAHSVERNGLRNVRLRNVCLAERTSARTLWLNRGMPNSFSLAHRAGPAAGLSVLAVSLDDLFAWEGLDRLDYLKIDAEGAEAEIVAGASITIEKYRPVVQLETTIRDADIRLPGYTSYRAPGSGNVVLMPDDHARADVPLRLGWSRVG